MKKKIVTLCLVAALMAVTVMGTLAYFTDTDEASNTFTMGRVAINLDEAEVVQQKDGSYAATSARTGDGCVYEDLFPGEVVPKDPTVTNTGSYDAYLRVTVWVPVGFCDYMFGSAVSSSALVTVFEDYDSSAWDFSEGTVDSSSVELVFDYNGIFAPEDKVVLFTGFDIPVGLTNEDVEEYGLGRFSLDIKAYATQVRGFAADISVFDAAERNAAFDACFPSGSSGT